MSDNSNHQASEFDFRDYCGETEDNENVYSSDRNAVSPEAMKYQKWLRPRAPNDDSIPTTVSLIED